MSICLGYDDSEARDGSGAQLQKVIGIYGMSKKFKTGFFFPGFNQIEPNPGDGVNSEESYKELLREINSTFSFEGKKCHRDHIVSKIQYTRLFRWDVTTKIWFLAQKMKCLIKKNHILLLIDSPYYFVERDPSVYLEYVKDFPSTKAISKSVEIQIHILGAKNTNVMMSERFIPIDWYISNLLVILDELSKLELPYKITIHTDAPRKSTSWNPVIPISKATLEYWKKGGLVNQDGQIILNELDIEETFAEFRNVTVVRDVSPVVAWQIMSNADIFLGAKSSFSIVGAILSTPSLSIFNKLQHNLPLDWEVVESANTINPSRVGNFLNNSSSIRTLIVDSKN